ncbi:hypothetical protein BV898_01663 [Hypsibius exemplaris]|uniref:MH2 domain-containing protein n=1 Tax=Hypsibius exemplaris TaxID=2072580 RepID=A0A1W0XAT1_HYPEX|nr:hypothetical protein BV898_01663 [Hypsibius exemplaris]
MPQRHSEKQLISSLHPSDYHSVDTESVHDKSDRCSSMETGISRVCGGQISAGTTTSASDDDADEDLSRDYPGAKQYCLQYNPGTNHPRSVSAALLLPPPPPSRGSNRRHHHWCLLRYWEESKSLGTGPFKVVQPILNVSHGAAAACRPSSSLECMSLAAIENPARSKVTQSLRDKIGLGMTLILDEEARTVQVYNRSAKLSLFVSSRYLTDTHHSGDGESESARPVKVPPGWLLTVCDLDWVRRPPKTADTTGTPMAAASTKLFDSILVSFGKGWGPGYHRQRVTSCNAWLEIALDNVQ